MKAVLVTTEYRGVFFGYITAAARKTLPKSIKLKNARNCIYWSHAARGVFGLASDGPPDGCRIGSRVSEIELYGITSVTPVEDGAVKKWEAAPWSS